MISYPRRQLGHGDIDKIIPQPLVHLLTPCLQRLPGKKPPGTHIIVPLDRHLATNNQKHNLRATI
jgi:hypothetical protein